MAGGGTIPGFADSATTGKGGTCRSCRKSAKVVLFDIDENDAQQFGH